MTNFRNRMQLPRIGFGFLVGATFCFLGLTSIQSRGPGGGEKPSRFSQAETGSGLTSQSQQVPLEGQSSQKPGKKPNASALYRKHCQKCHGSDGTGAEVRSTNSPEIPDFTSEKWQKGRNNARLVSSILDGRGTSMPPFSDKLSNEEVKALAAFVRSFDLPESKPKAATESDFEMQLQELFEQMKELRQQFRKLSQTPGKP